MPDILIQPNADADDDLSGGIVINDATLPLSAQDAVALGMTLGAAYKLRVLGDPATVTVTDVPAAFTDVNWSVVTGSGASELDVTIASLPADNGSAITDVEYDVDAAGTWISLGATTGTVTITMAAPGTNYAIRLRAVSDNGSAPAGNSESADSGSAAALNSLNVAVAGANNPFLRFTTINLGGATEPGMVGMASFTHTRNFRDSLVGFKDGEGTQFMAGLKSDGNFAILMGYAASGGTMSTNGVILGAPVNGERYDAIWSVDGATRTILEWLYRTWTGATPNAWTYGSEAFTGTLNCAHPVTLFNARGRDDRQFLASPSHGLALYPGVSRDLSGAGGTTFADSIFGSTLGAAVDRAALDADLGASPAVAQPEDATSLVNPGTIGNFEATQGTFTNA